MAWGRILRSDLPLDDYEYGCMLEWLNYLENPKENANPTEDCIETAGKIRTRIAESDRAVPKDLQQLKELRRTYYVNYEEW